jgi:hypothetical protein
MANLITIAEAAGLLGVSHATAKRRIRASGLGIHLRDDRLIAVRRSDLDRVARIAAGSEPAVDREPSDLISVAEAARLLRGSRQAVRRAADVGGLGIPVGGKRLSAVKYGALSGISALMHREAGNPVWISRRGIGPWAGRKKKPPVYMEK